MVHSLQYKLIELLILFLILPVSFVINYPIWLKVALGICAGVYIIWVLLKIEKYKFKWNSTIDWSTLWTRILAPLIVIITATTFYVWVTDKSQLFYVLLNNPKLWIFILLFYSLFSVYPQEVIYRTFFFKRYQSLFKNTYLLVFINALLFSLAHLFFKNLIVILLTFLGGILFALTYNKTRSTLLVTIEHSIYGCWLFTVGMGDMLGFPS